LTQLQIVSFFSILLPKARSSNNSNNFITMLSKAHPLTVYGAENRDCSCKVISPEEYKT